MVRTKNNLLAHSKKSKLGILHNSRPNTKPKLDMTKSKKRKNFSHLINTKNPNNEKLKFENVYSWEESRILTSSRTLNVTIHDVAEWLASIGCDVKKLRNNFYLFQNKIVSAKYLLVIANRARMKDKLPIFTLEEDF